ncbi:hypothetical protein EDB86DRAFT_2930463, partial [Lactarius hatsudake]
MARARAQTWPHNVHAFSVVFSAFPLLVSGPPHLGQMCFITVVVLYCVWSVSRTCIL